MATVMFLRTDQALIGNLSSCKKRLVFYKITKENLAKVICFIHNEIFSAKETHIKLPYIHFCKFI